jgi:hypothetical protein
MLGSDIMENVKNAIRMCDVEPKCVIGWRDGVSDAAFQEVVQDEVEGIRAGLGLPAPPGAGAGDSDSDDQPADKKRKSRGDEVPIAYVICQKAVANKFFCVRGNKGHGAPSGTLVSDLCGLIPAPPGGSGGPDSPPAGYLETFFINGRSPLFSTPKPVRFVVVRRDEGLQDVSLDELTWMQCHDYFNWTGPVKLPAVTQMAHKLAELAGAFPSYGEDIDTNRFVNKPFFL